MIVISNTSPLRYLVEIGFVDILPKLFGEVLIPPTVAAELQLESFPSNVREWIARPPGWLKIQKPVSPLPIPPDTLGAGEADAISLAIERRADRLLIDDQEGKKIAKNFQVRTVGTLAILAIGAELGYLSLKTAIDRLSQTKFRATRDLLERFLGSDPAIKELIDREAADLKSVPEGRDRNKQMEP